MSSHKFTPYDDHGFSQGSEEPITLKLGLAAEALGMLASETLETHRELIREAMEQVFLNLDGYRLGAVQIMPKLENVPGWRQPFLAGRDLGPGQEVLAWQLLPKNASSYELLGVSPSVSAERLKSAWRRMMLECHPDRNPGQEDAASEVSKRVNAAFEEILAEQQRQPSADEIPF
jgi:DnaJ-domain-containing protein 1